MHVQPLPVLLDQIHQKLPRTFVNVLTLFNVSDAWDIHLLSDYCILMWDTICKHECGCITASTSEKQRKSLDIFGVEYNKRIRKVAAEWQAKNLPEYTVKVQPFLENMIVPKDVGTLGVSELDCFHPSALADAGWAIGLWNSMLLPDSKKPTNMPQNISFICPTANTFLQ